MTENKWTRRKRPERQDEDWDAEARSQVSDGWEEEARNDASVFAPPVRLGGYEAEAWDSAADDGAEYAPQANVYRPLEATWAEERQEAIAQSELGYQVEAEAQPEKRKRKRGKRRHPWLSAMLILLALSAAAAAVLFLCQPVMKWLREGELLQEATEEPFTVVVTPEPVKAYEPAPKQLIPDSARAAVGTLSGTLQMEPCIVTENHIVMRHQQPNGSYDFYLYTSPEGRLLCYFEGLGANDMIPQENDTFHVKQAPYLIAANGSALIRTGGLEETIGEPVKLQPMYHGWSMVETDDEANYINRAGQLLSTLWFCRAFPFIGSYTVAYVDTGSMADADERYLLYVLGEDGNMTRWKSAGKTDQVLACACGVAYLRSGDLYRLPDTDAPLMNTPGVDAYPDCDALVVQHPQTGKYGLLVHGQQHYDCVYDAIYPMESDVQWSERTVATDSCRFGMHAVYAGYPQPLSHSFVLERDGQKEYVALSAQSIYPIRLDGEFGGE